MVPQGEVGTVPVGERVVQMGRRYLPDVPYRRVEHPVVALNEHVRRQDPAALVVEA